MEKKMHTQTLMRPAGRIALITLSHKAHVRSA